MLISPTEPPLLRGLGRTSLSPERVGCDVLIASKNIGAVGVQRKEVNDLVASVYDGRLNKELGQMERLPLAILVVEGRIAWTIDGHLTGYRGASTWSRSQHLGLLWSVQSRGVWVNSTDSLQDTCEYMGALERWLNRERQGSSLDRRPREKNPWGMRDNRAWGRHLLQGFEGVGSELADRIIDSFGGVPLQWTVSELDLQQVKGIGAKLAAKMFDALHVTQSLGQSSKSDSS